MSGINILWKYHLEPADGALSRAPWNLGEGASAPGTYARSLSESNHMSLE